MESWIVSEAGREVTVIDSDSAELALATALARVDASSSSSARSTQWVEVSVRGELTGEVGRAVVEVPPAEPPCRVLSGHMWREACDSGEMHRCSICGWWRHRTVGTDYRTGERYTAITYIPRSEWL